MPVRHIETARDLGAAVVVGRSRTTGNEAWLIDENAPVAQIVAECSAYLALDNARCDQISHKGQRRALWLALAVLVGLALPSPLRHLYGEHDWLLHATEIAGYAIVVALLVLAGREHLGMRRLLRS